MLLTERPPVSVPERGHGGTELDGHGANHHVHERVPLVPGPSNHGRGNQGAKHATEAVGPVEEAEDLVRIEQVPDPGIPCRILEAVAEAGKDEGDDNDGIRGVVAHDDVGDKAACGRYDGDAALPEGGVYAVDDECGGKVADGWGDEDDGDDDVG